MLMQQHIRDPKVRGVSQNLNPFCTECRFSVARATVSKAMQGGFTQEWLGHWASPKLSGQRFEGLYQKDFRVLAASIHAMIMLVS